ncbi:MAG: TrmO family methyltransferase, partial [Marinomonas sp.]
GQKKMGVFATRATHRPNPIGLSVVKMGCIYKEDTRVFIDLHGADLLDGTPVLDIKPYLPYADNISEAKGGFAHIKSSTYEVQFSAKAKLQCEQYETENKKTIISLIEQVIAQDPRPSYLSDQIDREHGIRLWDINVKWCARSDHFEILEIEHATEIEI